MRTELRVGLVRGRHPLPVDKYVLDAPVSDVHAYSEIERRVRDWLHESVIGTDLHTVEIYLTGLGSAVTSFLKMWVWAKKHHVMPLLQMAHYDRDLDGYRMQSWDVMIE